jgi:sporulation protein YqfC
MKGGSFFMAKTWGQRVRHWMARKMDLPQDVMMDLPRITMIGQIHIYIENHRGLLTFTDNELRLLLKQGQLMVKGKAFVIKTILPEEILLEGKIDQVIYIKEDSGGTK